MPNHDLTYIGRTESRYRREVFGIKQADRLSHLYIVGKTGTGKTTLVESLALQDIRAGRGLALLDPHGDLAARVAGQVPASRASDLLYLNVPDPRQPYGYNPLASVKPEQIPVAASALLSAFEKIWSGKDWGNRMSHILRSALYALIEYGNATLPDVLRILSDAKYRDRVLADVANPQIRDFWTNEYAKYQPAYRQQAIAPIQNKVGAFLADPRLYRIFTTGTLIDLRPVMDGGKIFVVNLSKGALGEDSASLFGALLVSTMTAAAFGRIDTLETQRRPYFVFLDEFQNFTTLAVASMVSELRKMKLALTLSHQNLQQLTPDVRSAILGNVGTMILFRIGAEDAPLFAREFAPVCDAEDLISIPNHSIRLKLMIDGAPSRPFSAVTLTPEAIEHHRHGMPRSLRNGR